MTPTLIAFDTSTEDWSVALEVAGRVHAHECAAGARAAATLVPVVMGLLREAGVTLVEVDAIAFGRGPGAFTGLRTACAAAQGLAVGSGKPVLAIDTLMAVAEDAQTRAPGPARAWVAMDARMQEIYAAEYERQDDGWRVVRAPMLTAPAQLQAWWHDEPPQWVLGTALTAFTSGLDTLGARTDAHARPRATAMLTLARAAWARGQALDAALALPLYLRDRVALTTLEREAVAAAKRAGRTP